MPDPVSRQPPADPTATDPTPERRRLLALLAGAVTASLTVPQRVCLAQPPGFHAPRPAGDFSGDWEAGSYTPPTPWYRVRLSLEGCTLQTLEDRPLGRQTLWMTSTWTGPVRTAAIVATRRGAPGAPAEPPSAAREAAQPAADATTRAAELAAFATELRREHRKYLQLVSFYGGRYAHIQLDERRRPPWLIFSLTDAVAAAGAFPLVFQQAAPAARRDPPATIGVYGLLLTTLLRFELGLLVINRDALPKKELRTQAIGLLNQLAAGIQPLPAPASDRPPSETKPG